MNTIKEIIKSGIENGLLRLNKISSFKWELKEIKFSIESTDYESICVYLTAKNWKKSFFSLFINKNEASKIFKLFSGYFLTSISTHNKSYEIIIAEIGNIILNSILSNIANKTKTVILPEVPKTINGEKKFILENLSTMIEENKNKLPLVVQLTMESMNETIKTEIYVFIEEDLKSI